MKEWNIGNKVKVIDRDAIPAELKVKIANGNTALWTGPKSRLAGMVGVVVDKLYSEAAGCHVYKLKLEGFDRASNAVFVANDLEELPKPTANLRFEIEILEDVVVARMFDGDTQLAIGHGHVFHDVALGIAQAGSYAMKKCYIAMGGSFPKKGGCCNG